MPTPTRTESVLRVAFDQRLDLAAGLLAPRLLRRGPELAEVALVATGATLLGGDRIDIELSVGAGRTLRVAYHGRGHPAALHARLRVGPGAVLVWDAQPLVLATGADVVRSLDAEVAEGGVLLVRDTLVLGRAGENGGVLRCRTSVTYDDRPALVESLSLDARRHDVGVLGPHRVVDSALAVGTRPEAAAGTVFDLAEPGRLVRWLGAATHASPMATVWWQWTGGPPDRA
jgi:urease accessory protein